MRLLRERLAYEIARHERHRRPLAVIVLDLDGFKSVNDRFGHAAGDEVLCALAEALTHTVREQDTIVRQGGDEFCVLAPETGRRRGRRPSPTACGGASGARSCGVSGLGASFGAAIYPARRPARRRRALGARGRGGRRRRSADARGADVAAERRGREGPASSIPWRP